MKKKYNISREFLIREYIINNKSSYQIAKELGCSQGSVYMNINKYNIKTRTRSEAKKGQKFTKEHRKNLSGKNSGRYKHGETLKKYHCIEPNCNNEITYQGALYNSGRCRSCASIIQNIGRKQTKESIQKRIRKGSNHWNWQGGISSLGQRIKSLFEYKTWRNEVYKRDYWTCQKCDYKGKNIEAHHIKSFSELLSEFLKEYDQFSPIEDKETLVRLAMKWSPFWEISNGKTLCKDCHNLTKGFKNV